jgi:hypothetical protein
LRFPLFDPRELPEPGASREGLQLDLKATVDAKNGFELAKDVAAFANSAGGTILVGAHEGANNTLGKYAAMAESLAGTIRDAYNKAVSARCAPAPIVDPVLIPRDGGWLVAVNVWPFPGQPVGVSTRDHSRGGVGDNGWAFPLRTGVHTIFLKPEQLPMLMVPDARRVAILLEQVPLERRQKVQVFWHDATSNGRHLQDRYLALVEVRPLENVAVFVNRNVIDEMYPTMSSGVTKALHLPLDAIRSVWSDGDGDWAVLITGRIEETVQHWLAWFPGALE